MFYQKKSGLGENILDGGQTINAALASDKKKKLPKTQETGHFDHPVVSARVLPVAMRYPTV